jgi:hypothetical protein
MQESKPKTQDEKPKHHVHKKIDLTHKNYKARKHYVF